MYLKEAKLNEQLYYKLLECAATWPRFWTPIQQIIDNNLQSEMEIHYEGLNKKTRQITKQPAATLQTDNTGTPTGILSMHFQPHQH